MFAISKVIEYKLMFIIEIFHIFKEPIEYEGENNLLLLKVL